MLKLEKCSFGEKKSISTKKSYNVLPAFFDYTCADGGGYPAGGSPGYLGSGPGYPCLGYGYPPPGEGAPG